MALWATFFQTYFYQKYRYHTLYYWFKHFLSLFWFHFSDQTNYLSSYNFTVSYCNIFLKDHFRNSKLHFSFLSKCFTNKISLLILNFAYLKIEKFKINILNHLICNYRCFKSCFHWNSFFLNRFCGSFLSFLYFWMFEPLFPDR